jgi:hypothetical protein
VKREDDLLSASASALAKSAREVELPEPNIIERRRLKEGSRFNAF